MAALLGAVLCALAIQASTPGSAKEIWLQSSSCTFTLSPPKASVYRTGGTGAVRVTIPPGCPWMATSDANWITIVSGMSGIGDGTVTYWVAANSGPGRSGTIEINNAPVIITQPNDLNPENVSILMSDLPGNRLARFTDLAGTNWETGPPASAGSLKAPWHVSFDAQGRIYVADRDNYRIVRMDDLAGSGWKTFTGVGFNTFNQLNWPISVSVDPAGRLYFPFMSGIARVDDMDGAGWTTFGPTPSGPGSFNNPKVVAFDRQGRIYVSDTDNYRIVRFNDMQGTDWTSFGSQGSGVGQFNRPEGVALDSLGRIYITDNENQRIVRIDDMTGTGWITYGSFGSGVNQLWEPHDIAVSVRGRIYIADTGNGRVVRIDDITGAGWTAFGTSTIQTGPPGTNTVPPGLYEFIAPKGIRLWPVSVTLPALTLGLNQTAFRLGQTMSLTATLSPGPIQTLVDAYVVIRLPDGRLLSLTSDGIVPGIVPAATSFTLFSLSLEIFRYTFAGSEPAGTYTWFAGLTQAGTLNVIGNVDQRPFTFTREIRPGTSP